jgi:glutaconate CoA-transferase, subunit B
MIKDYTDDYTVKELMAVFLSRDLGDGETAHLGANQPIARAAVLLAHLMHGPNMRISQSLTLGYLANEPCPETYSDFFSDWRRSRWAEAYRLGHEVFADVKRFADFFFLGAIQIDRYGNANLIGIGSNYRRLTFRGPGCGASSMAATFCPRFYLISHVHQKRLFVQKCDYISAFGWGHGGTKTREELGLPGGGPKYVITPLGIMDFEEETKRMRLKSIHRGVNVDDIVKNTGFELIIPQEIPLTEPPTIEEIETIRERIDPQGILRTGA